MGAGGSDDDLGAHGSNSDFDSRVSILSELPSQDLVEFREEDSVSDELKAMANKQKPLGEMMKQMEEMIKGNGKQYLSLFADLSSRHVF